MITFEDRAVAFIDVLGFKDLTTRAVGDPVARTELTQLVSLLSGVITYLDEGVQKSVPPELIPEHLYISDCIVLSAPLKVLFDKFRNYSGLDILVMRIIQVAHAILDAGYLVRGGIAIGPVWHNRANVVGPAYQEALCLERGGGWQPRVLLSADAARLWKHGGPSSGSRMCNDYQGAFMVNSLHDYYVPERFRGTIEEAFAHYDAIAARNLGSGIGVREKQKWAWMKQYILDERSMSCP